MRRELHERFMPDCVWTDNKNKTPTITFFIHRVIHSARADDRTVNHGMPCFQGSFAAENARDDSALWKTMAFESSLIGNQWHLIMRIEIGSPSPGRHGIFAGSSAVARAAAWEVSAIHTRRSPFVARGARSRPCG
jgi:hypothetical protein